MVKAPGETITTVKLGRFVKSKPAHFAPAACSTVCSQHFMINEYDFAKRFPEDLDRAKYPRLDERF